MSTGTNAKRVFGSPVAFRRHSFAQVVPVDSDAVTESEGAWGGTGTGTGTGTPYALRLVSAAVPCVHSMPMC